MVMLQCHGYVWVWVNMKFFILDMQHFAADKQFCSRPAHVTRKVCNGFIFQYPPLKLCIHYKVLNCVSAKNNYDILNSNSNLTMIHLLCSVPETLIKVVNLLTIQSNWRWAFESSAESKTSLSSRWRENVYKISLNSKSVWQSISQKIHFPRITSRL